MNVKQIFIVLVCCLGLLAFQSAMAASDAIKTMAGIMVNLNHYPSDSEKQTLQGLVDNADTSANEKVLATAMINLQHSATAEDKTKLSAIMKDGKASADEKALAEIIHNLSHMPSGGDKKKLQAMMK